jgi:HPt (histidine-containing phosphotransfer) domain-containing protein
VDLKVLTALVGDDPAVIDEMLQVFRRSVMQSSHELRHGVNTDSPERVTEAAHKLKSAARSIGAHRLADICVDIEAVAEIQNTAELAALLTHFETELDAVNHLLESRKEPHGSTD